MDLKRLPSKLSSIGINPRFAIDVASVANANREYGLLHIEHDVIEQTKDVLQLFECEIVAERGLVFLKDPQSREGLFLDPEPHQIVTHSEIWYTAKGNLNASRIDPFSNPGKYLSYPGCCVDAYERSSGLGEFYRRYLFSSDTIRHNEINRLCTIFCPDLLMPDFFPCSLSCNSAKDFAESMLGVSDLIFTEEEIARTKRFMNAPIILLEKQLLCFPDFERVKNVLHLYHSKDTRKVELTEILDSELVVSVGPGVNLVRFQNVNGVDEMFLTSHGVTEKLQFSFI